MNFYLISISIKLFKGDMNESVFIYNTDCECGIVMETGYRGTILHCLN